MPFFDFHCHPGLKPQFANPQNKPTPWDKIKAMANIFPHVSIDINFAFNDILGSQSNFTQIYNGNVTLLGLVLHAPESHMGVGLLSRKFIQKGDLPEADAAQIEYVATGKHYFDLINTELNWIKNAPKPEDLKDVSINILSTKADYVDGNNKVINCFLIIEGLHCFLGDPDALDAKDVFWKNFKSFTSDQKIVAINICHIQQSSFCNHAHGIQFFDNELFYPTGDGITPWGYEVLDEMVKREILVDVKHMSLKSRLSYYEYNKDTSGNYKNPIICTHAGITGMSMQNRVKYINQLPVDKGSVYEIRYFKPRSSHIKEAYYNISSINLYDEDIEAILLSGGLIGISFDQRIIGFANENVIRDVTTPEDVEFISKSEAGFFLGPDPTQLPVFANDNETWTSEDFENLYDPSLDEIMHKKFFANQIIHILFVAKSNPAIGVKKAAAQICIGSDFDGLINAIDNCKQINLLSQFKNSLNSLLPSFFKDNHLDSEITDVNAFTDGLFFNNGKNFVLSNLS